MTSAMFLTYFLSMVSILANVGLQAEAKRRNVLQDKHLKVAAVHYYPNIIFYCNEKEMDRADDCPDKDNMTYGGVLWEFLDMIKRARNVTFSILAPPTQTWGYCYSKNNCTGMIGMVNRREVDFALGIFVVSLVRLRLSVHYKRRRIPLLMIVEAAEKL